MQKGRFIKRPFSNRRFRLGGRNDNCERSKARRCGLAFEAR